MKISKELLRKIILAVRKLISALERIPGMPSWVARYIVPILMLIAAVLAIVIVIL